MAGSGNCNHRNYAPQTSASGRKAFRRVRPDKLNFNRGSQPFNSDTLRIFSFHQESYQKCEKGRQRLTANQRAMIASLGHGKAG